MLLAASVTDSLVTLATHIIRDLGYGGVTLLMFSSGVIALPGTEATMLFSGFNVYEHHLTLVGIILFGLLGDLLGATVAYGIGRFGGGELLERHGSKVHISQSRLALAHRWFERYGAPVILVSRLIPLIRLVFPYAAGLAEMAYVRLLLFAALGSAVWVTGLSLLGRAVGRNWPSWRHNLEYVDYAALALLVVAIVWLVVRRSRARASGDGPAADVLAD